MSPSPKKELLIWWTSNPEAIAIGAEAPQALPEYVREQFRERRGQCVATGARMGPSQALWVDKKFGAREIKEWPDTFIGGMLRDGTSQGIVFTSPEVKLFKGVPGVVTDFQLRMIVVT